MFFVSNRCVHINVIAIPLCSSCSSILTQSFATEHFTSTHYNFLRYYTNGSYIESIQQRYQFSRFGSTSYFPFVGLLLLQSRFFPVCSYSVVLLIFPDQGTGNIHRYQHISVLVLGCHHSGWHFVLFCAENLYCIFASIAAFGSDQPVTSLFPFLGEYPRRVKYSSF